MPLRKALTRLARTPIRPVLTPRQSFDASKSGVMYMFRLSTLPLARFGSRVWMRSRRFRKFSSETHKSGGKEVPWIPRMRWLPHYTTFQRFWQSIGGWAGFREWMTRKRFITIFNQKFETSASEMCAHTSFSFLALSYWVSDKRHRRLCVMASLGSIMIFNFWHPVGFTMWLQLKWNVVFLALNYAWVSQMDNESRMKWLDAAIDKEGIHRHVFPSLHKVDFGRIMRKATCKEFPQGHVLIREGEKTDVVYLIVSGTAEVRHNSGEHTWDVQSSQFVGTSGVHSSLYIERAHETVVVTSPFAQVLEWKKDKLIRVIENNPNIQAAVDAALSIDQLRKAFAKGGLIPKDTTRMYDQLVQSLLEEETHVSKRAKEALRKFRHLYHVPSSYHISTIEKYGWSERQFHRGFRYQDPSDAESLHSEGALSNWLGVIRRSIYTS
ncbi:hypothetical protein AAMO2058_000332800 [Amorphochlora amoebiformis]